MKFWKFIGEDHKSLTSDYNKIEYIVGETIEVGNYNPDKKIQCSEGIHCLKFSNEKYEYHNIIIGPKVAILEVEEEDIIYFKEKGKCRVRKAKVLEIKEPEDWMKTGNNNVAWALDYALYVEGHNGVTYNLILNSENPEYLYLYSYKILKKYDEKIYNALIEIKDIYYLYHYGTSVLKKYNKKIHEILEVESPRYYANFYKKFFKKGN